jgi:hypothetical protein
MSDAGGGGSMYKVYVEKLKEYEEWLVAQKKRLDERLNLSGTSNSKGIQIKNNASVSSNSQQSAPAQKSPGETESANKKVNDLGVLKPRIQLLV